MFSLIGVLCLLHATLATAQLITLRDGKIGVNFAGYHADAGLGGLLTGNAAHGGLSASAGTPWGARSAAGLGGNLDGRTSGLAYAAAQANDEVGASAVLGGSVGERGYAGSEAHANGKVAATHYVKSALPAAAVAPPAEPTDQQISHVQRVKPPKKYSLIRPDPLAKSQAKSVVQTRTVQPAAPVQSAHKGVILRQANPADWLSIPIGILNSIQQSLGPLTSGQAPPPQNG